MSITYILYYLAGISFISAIFFLSDKAKAKNNKRRISEKTLHILEFAGGAGINLILMYLVRHKNRKSSYYLYTYVAFILWLMLAYFYYKNLA